MAGGSHESILITGANRGKHFAVLCSLLDVNLSMLTLNRYWPRPRRSLPLPTLYHRYSGGS